MNNENKIGLVLPFICPGCLEELIVKMNLPSPEIVEVIKVKDADEEIKNLLKPEKDVVTKEPKTA